jgi:YD repeat-containing protein
VGDVFVRDRVAGKTRRLSVSSDGAQANGASSQPSISADGLAVAFRSQASNLDVWDYNGVADVFVREDDPITAAGGEAIGQTGVSGGLTTRVSGGGGASSEPSISADGARVAYTSVDSGGRDDVFVRDRRLGRTVFDTLGMGQADFGSPSLSGDGTFVAFGTDASLFLESNGVSDVYEVDLETGGLALLSVDDDIGPGDGPSGAPSLSGDGTHAAFSSRASNFGADANARDDVFVHIWGAGADPQATLASSWLGGGRESLASSGGLAGACAGGAPSGGDSAQSDAASHEYFGFVRRGFRRCDLDWGSRGIEGPEGGCGEGELAANATKCQADPVNTATGSYTTQVKDLALAGIGLGFELVRTYNSGDLTEGPLGRGWTHSYQSSLSIRLKGAVVVARGAEGQRLTFQRRPDGSYASAPGGRATLVGRDGGFELVRRDQVRYRFDAAGRLVGLVERNGQGLGFSYDSAGKLSRITDSVGRTITLSYTGGLLSAVALPDGRKVSYAYTGGLLSSVTDVRGAITRYEYAGGRLSKVVDQNANAVVATTYEPGGRVSAQTDALGKRTTFSWDSQTQTATVTDPRGEKWRDVYAGHALVGEQDPWATRAATTTTPI